MMQVGREPEEAFQGLRLIACEGAAGAVGHQDDVDGLVQRGQAGDAGVFAEIRRRKDSF